jgi:peptide/nickel transport system permease protein
LLALVLRRLVWLPAAALGVATLVFVALEAAPGDPADLLLGDRPVPPEVRERIERAYGFDRPPLVRYGRWLSALFLEGELGWSHSRGRPVAQALADALPPTLLLSGAALLAHLVLGVAAGVVSGAGRGRAVDRALTVLGLAIYGMPTFWIGLMAILLASYVVPLFPASSMSSVGAERLGWIGRSLDGLWHLVLPAAVLGVGSAAALARFVRAGLIETLDLDFVRAARARGVSERDVLWRHALRSSLIPVINQVGLSLPVLVSGSLVVEVVFAWPGMGRLTYDALRAYDLPVVLAATMLSTVLVLIGSLLADLAMFAVDRRIRLGGSGAARPGKVA